MQPRGEGKTWAEGSNDVQLGLLRLSLETDKTWSKPDSGFSPRPSVLYSKLILISNTL